MSLRDVLKVVDPQLTVISGNVHRRKKHRISKQAWDAAGGVFCQHCGQETVRMFDGLCPNCHYDAIAKREDKHEQRAERRYYQRKLSEGTISLAQLREGRL